MDEASADLPTAPLAALCSGNPLVAWLWEKGWTLPTLGELTQGLGRAMNVAGIPVMRLRVTLRTMHPQLAGLSYTWRRDTDEVEKFWPPLTVLQQDMFLKSPYALIFEGAGAVRRRLDIPEAAHDFPILEELGAMGATDYVALPLVFEDGRIHAMTIASDQPGGFSTSELETVAETQPVLARLLELHALRRTARTVLDTYLGKLTGERVWQGLIHRGDGEDIFAVIWFSDLRSSTALADALPRPVYLDLLNDYFECTAGAVLHTRRRSAEVHRRRHPRHLPDRRPLRTSGDMRDAQRGRGGGAGGGERGPRPHGASERAARGGGRAAPRLRHRPAPGRRHVGQRRIARNASTSPSSAPPATKRRASRR